MLHKLLARPLEDTPDRPILEFYGDTWSCQRLEDTAHQLAIGLMDSGVEPMDRIAVLLPNCPETVVLYLACFKAGFVMVPMDYRHHVKQINFTLMHSGANVLIVHSKRLKELEREGVLANVTEVLVVGGGDAGSYTPLLELTGQAGINSLSVDFQGNDLAIMIYTSGTTSRPKGVTLTREAIVAGIKKYLALVPLRTSDTALIAASITRPMALRTQLLPMLHVGGCVALRQTFEVNDFMKALQQPPEKTFIALLPSALQQVLHHGDIDKCDFSKLRLCVVGGDRVPMRLHQQFRQRTGVAITEQCGATEVGPYALNPPFGHKKEGSIGLPMYGTQVCIVDDQDEDIPVGQIGEIIVNSPLMMEGYWNDTALTRKTMKDGWIRTGDLGRFDSDGYLWFMGRKKDIIVRGGSNISPLEIETALLNHESVSEACVVGITHSQLGEEVHAFVTLFNEMPPVKEEELRAFLNERLADYMVPSKIQILHEMPRKGAGKMDRDRLRWQAEAGIDL